MSEKAPVPPPLKVEDIMTANVMGVPPEMTVRDAMLMLSTHKISGAPVVNNMNKVLSVVSEGDLIKLAATEGMDKTISTCLPKLCKTENLMTLKKTNTFAEAYMMFLSKGVHRIIVIDGNGNLQGIVSRSNVLRVICSTSDSQAAVEPKTAKSG